MVLIDLKASLEMIAMKSKVEAIRIIDLLIYLFFEKPFEFFVFIK